MATVDNPALAVQGTITMKDAPDVDFRVDLIDGVQVWSKDGGVDLTAATQVIYGMLHGLFYTETLGRYDTAFGQISMLGRPVQYSATPEFTGFILGERKAQSDPKAFEEWRIMFADGSVGWIPKRFTKLLTDEEIEAAKQ